MGLRVNRVMGFALTDVHFTDGRLTDERINRDSPVLTAAAGRDLTGALVAYITARYDDEDERAHHLFAVEGADPDAPAEAVVINDHAEDGRERGVLVIRPILMTSWHRRDDEIDYHDASHRAAGTTPIIDVLDFGLYPYEGRRMDADTGVTLSRRIADEFRFLSNAPQDVNRDQFAQRLFSATWEQLRQRVVPDVPYPIRDLIAWAGLFTDAAVIGQMRPVIYTYWR